MLAIACAKSRHKPFLLTWFIGMLMWQAVGKSGYLWVFVEKGADNHVPRRDLHHH